jgi:hypothetical protein
MLISCSCVIVNVCFMSSRYENNAKCYVKIYKDEEKYVI